MGHDRILHLVVRNYVKGKQKKKSTTKICVYQHLSMAWERKKNLLKMSYYTTSFTTLTEKKDERKANGG